MEEIEIVDDLNRLPTPSYLVVGLAVSGSRKSKYVVQWALQKFVPEGMLMFKLLHVRPVISAVPTPMGNTIPISQVREDVVNAFRKEVEWQAYERLLPYKKICVQRKIQVEIIQLESDDIVNALAKEVTKSSIKKLVLGASSRGMFSRGRNLSARISECIPNFCTVYAVSRGKLSSVRPSSSETIANSEDHNSSSLNQTLSLQPAISDTSSDASYSHFHSPSLPMQRFEALSNINQMLLHKRTSSTETSESRPLTSESWDEKKTLHSDPSNPENSYASSSVSSFTSIRTDNHSWTSDQASVCDAAMGFSSESQANINFELEKLRIELRHVQGMYAVAQRENVDASRKLSDLHKRRLEESIKLKESNLKEVEAMRVAEQEKNQYEAAKREAKYVRECAKQEAAKRKEADSKALPEANEKEKLRNTLSDPLQLYQEFSWEEIVSASSSFSQDLKLGKGAYGTVYKCSFHDTVAAVKVLHSQEVHRTKQFQQELEILSRIQHPHLLVLLGACVDRGCLVYEYMENGSLEERLFRKNGTAPIPWFERYRIAWEVASALDFLHNSKPRSIIHRDLKPANILLDHNFVSKIGDVGLSTMLQSDSSMSTIYKDTAPAGTLCYIDPEYQRTGQISPKSDVYALGMVIMQLLTAKPAYALAHNVETAIDDDCLVELLDSEAGDWPVEETKELAILGLRCAELRRRDRPDLKDEILPALHRLKDIADRARLVSSTHRQSPPNHFICPITKDVMDDPCVAADGYTYDRKAITTWLEENDTSPMTNLPLDNKTLLPNYTLLSAIMEWKSGRR